MRQARRRGSGCAFPSRHEAPIRPLLESLSFTQGKPNWGYAFRVGLLKVTADDMALIAKAMQARPPP